MSDVERSSRPEATKGRRKRSVATIRHVAEAAGVSTATVSKFVNGAQRFSRDVEARITEAIEQLNYRSNPLASGMITGRTGNVGVVILDIANPYFTNLVRGASRVAAQADLNLLVADAVESRSPPLAMLQALSRRVDGLIVSARLPDPVIAWLGKSRVPAVFYGGTLKQPGFHSLSCDNRSAGLMLGRHLRELGHRRLGYIGYSAARWSGERLAGLREGFGGTEADWHVFDIETPNADAGERIASSVLLDRAQPLDAVVAYNDLIALGFMAEARTLGVRVPDDVSVAGFDNIVYGRYTSPSLTTVDMMSELQGETAMRTLISLISDEVLEAGHEMLTGRVVARESTRRRGRGE